jgi:hypothetical protein
MIEINQINQTNHMNLINQNSAQLFGRATNEGTFYGGVSRSLERPVQEAWRPEWRPSWLGRSRS